MGMDVNGNSGNYFRNSIWRWHPLADYIEQVAPDIAKKNPGWHANDGDGLNAADSLALAEKLQQEIDSGRCQQYVEQFDPETYQSMQKTMTDMLARLVGPGGEFRAEGWAFSSENLQRFINFLRESQGFHIW